MKSDPDSSISAPEFHDPAYPSSVSFADEDDEADEAEQTRQPFKFRWQRAFMASDLPSITRHILHVLAAYMNAAGGNCYPSIDRIVSDTGLSRTAVRLHLQTAVETGWIKRWERRENGEPLAGKAAQGWRHYNYLPVIPEHSKRGVRGDPPSEKRGVRGDPKEGEFKTKKENPEKEPEREPRAGATAGSNEATGSGKLSLFFLEDFLRTLPDYETASDWLPMDWIDEAGKRMDEADCLDDSSEGPETGCCLGFREFWQAAAADGKPSARKSAEGWRLAWLHWVRRAIEYHLRKFPERVEAIYKKKTRNQTATPIAMTCGNCAHLGAPLPLPGDTFHHCTAGKGKPHVAAARYPNVNGIQNCVKPAQSPCDGWKSR